MALSSSNAVKQLSDGNSQGTSLGQTSTDKISFYNATPIAKPGITGSSFASISQSSGALSSTLAIALNNLGLIQCTSVAA